MDLLDAHPEFFERGMSEPVAQDAVDRKNDSVVVRGVSGVVGGDGDSAGRKVQIKKLISDALDLLL